MFYRNEKWCSETIEGEPNRVKYEFVRTELQNELNMMHSSDENIELCSVDRFGSIEPDFLQKK